jgi:hypothetical protein
MYPDGIAFALRASNAVVFGENALTVKTYPVSCLAMSAYHEEQERLRESWREFADLVMAMVQDTDRDPRIVLHRVRKRITEVMGDPADCQPPVDALLVLVDAVHVAADREGRGAGVRPDSGSSDAMMRHVLGVCAEML